MQFKVAALQALSASAKVATQGPLEAAQHVATCMLLCSFEILLPSESSGEWLWYIRGAMEIVQSALLVQHVNESDIGSLLDWVYYHHAVSQFATFHWRHKSVVLSATDAATADLGGNRLLPFAKESPVSPSPRPTYAILNLLSEVCDTLLDPSDPASHDERYKDRLKALEWRIRNLPPASPPQDATSLETSADVQLPVELYQTATLVYLLRASQSPWEPPADLDSVIDRAFAGPIQAPACEHFFPMFILACEARTDEQRVAILDLLDRTERNDHMRSMKGFRAEIQSFWVQQDLNADSDLVLNYVGVMKAVVSSNKALPSYA
ncbi:uncharacterized protein JN550_003175 [Neoarthrinium moseri]|uniref:uncharacterized protein n=1 Tax=Neoarthrinium moseri TaxID=1658444 RepID=UPI001FDB5BCF|nr:uncharacterized protein JN550_003175 [Neoarthrinium moseri]KAI1873906.1 hypothetical protein JN550_003175 [Neoarthrinium moseri]